MSSSQKVIDRAGIDYESLYNIMRIYERTGQMAEGLCVLIHDFVLANLLCDAALRREWLHLLHRLVSSHFADKAVLDFVEEAYRRLDYARRHGLEIPLIEDLEQRAKHKEFWHQFAEVNGLQDYFPIYNIECRDSSDEIVESHAVLYVARDVERAVKGKYDSSRDSKNVYEGALLMQKKGAFLPSARLSAVVLFDRLGNIEKYHDEQDEKFVQQHKDRGDSYGWHKPYTVFGENAEGKFCTIDYPDNLDFARFGRTLGEELDTSRRKETLIPEGLPNWDCQRVSNIPDDSVTAKFMKDAWSVDKQALLKLGKHFGRTSWFGTPERGRANAAWLGCYSYDFSVSSYYVLDNGGALRRVQSKPKPEAKPKVEG